MSEIKIYSYTCFLNTKGRVVYGNNGHGCEYPYYWNKKYNSWVNCSGELTPEALRARWKRGNLRFN